MADLPRQVGGSPHCDRLHLAPQELLHSDLEGNSVLAQATPGSHGFLFDAEAWLAGRKAATPVDRAAADLSRRRAGAGREVIARD